MGVGRLEWFEGSGNREGREGGEGEWEQGRRKREGGRGEWEAGRGMGEEGR